jgi:hypothetical protein
MGVKCVEGASMACSVEQSRNFGGAVSPAILAYEQVILSHVFGIKSLSVWEQNPNYHAYYNLGVLGQARSLDAAWLEYRRQPAPLSAGRLARPVTNGQTSQFVFAMPRSAISASVRVPLPGGWVTHYVNENLYCIVNATNRAHALHPGHIMRWLKLVGNIVVSNTLGRGIGAQARLNEFYGVRIFGDLDRSISQSLRSR